MPSYTGKQKPAGDKPKVTLRIGNGPEHDFTDGNLSAAGTKELADSLKKSFGRESNMTPPPASEGHNSGGKKPPRVGGVAVDQLKSIIARVEKLEEEKAGLGADIRDVYSQAKGSGFDVKAIRTIIKLRKMDAQSIEEQETILDTYKRALGMQPSLFDEQEEEDAA